MSAFVFKCPVTAQHVQGWVDDDADSVDEDDYRVITCLACQRIHRVNPTTGKILGHSAGAEIKVGFAPKSGRTTG
jgi:hypothetical protein